MSIAPPQISDVVSVEEVFGLVERSLTAGGIYHQRGTYLQEVGESRFEVFVEIWVDGGRDAVRIESSRDGSSDEVSLTVDGVRYLRGQRLEPVTCRGAGSAVTALLGCGDEMHVEVGVDQGQPALVLVSTSEIEGNDGTSRTTSRLVVDAATGLPKSLSSEGEYDIGRAVPLSTDAHFEGEFLERDAATAELFDPQSLGFATDPEQELPEDVPVHWIGHEFDPGNGLPPLFFAQVERGSELGPGYSAILRYSSGPTGTAQPLVLIQVWPKSKFEQSGFPATPCAGEPLLVAVGTATFQCSGQDDGSVLVDTSETVLWITAPPTHSAGGELPNPYRDRAALTLVVEALRLRSPR